MKEIIKQSTITETIDGKEFTVIISKWEWGYYWLLRMGTLIPGDYKDVRDYFTAIFKKLGTNIIEVPLIKVNPGKKPRADKWKTHNYPVVKKEKKHVGRPKGKPRGPRKPKDETKRPEDITSEGFISEPVIILTTFEL